MGRVRRRGDILPRSWNTKSTGGEGWRWYSDQSPKFSVARPEDETKPRVRTSQTASSSTVRIESSGLTAAHVRNAKELNPDPRSSIELGSRNSHSAYRYAADSRDMA